MAIGIACFDGNPGFDWDCISMKSDIFSQKHHPDVQMAIEKNCNFASGANS